MNTSKQQQQKQTNQNQVNPANLERLKSLRYMDDEFFTVCLEDNFEAVELILRIVLGRSIKIKSIRVQEVLKNLQGRSAILDIHAIDTDSTEMNIEIQRNDKGADAKRARHNSSLLDAHILKPGEATENIPDSYVIFITENDIMKGGQPIYAIERYVAIGNEKVLFGDGSHIIYVNGQYRGDDEIGKLMHDFSCTNPDDMNYDALAKWARYFKQDEKGVRSMSKIMEDMKNEKAKEIAIRMIRAGKMPLEDIANYTELSIEELKELESQAMQTA